MSLTANFLRKHNATHALASLSTFLSYMQHDPAAKAAASQTQNIKRICGSPCSYQFLLRTETLDADWLALLGTLHLPLRPLTHVNVANAAEDAVAVRKAMYTPEMVQMVLQMEQPLFTEYGYPREP
jgi:hypothetical protein